MEKITFVRTPFKQASEAKFHRDILWASVPPAEWGGRFQGSSTANTELSVCTFSSHVFLSLKTLVLKVGDEGVPSWSRLKG